MRGGQPLLLDVAFLPRDLDAETESVAIVVDVIRASTSMATLFAQGCPIIYAARTLEEGTQFARGHRLTLCGERGGARPEGFDYGNSPSQFATERFTDRPVVLCTTNGTVALHAVAASPAVFIGCLANATAVVEAALSAAVAVGRLTVVCAGREGCYALDDAWTAGRLIDLARQRAGSGSILTDAALAAVALPQAIPDPREALQQSGSGRGLLPLGLGHDVAYCALQDRCAVAPRLVAEPAQNDHPVLLLHPPAAEHR